MNSVGIALRAYAAGMVHGGAGPDKFAALCEDIVNDPFMACQLADLTADPEDEQRWVDTSHAWRLFGYRGCVRVNALRAEDLPDPEASPAAVAAAEYLGYFVERLSA